MSEIEPTAAIAPQSAVRHVQIDAEEQGQRLDKVLARLLPGVPRSRIFRLIRRGEVRVNGRRASPEQRLAAGDSVRLPPVRESGAAMRRGVCRRRLIAAHRARHHS